VSKPLLGILVGAALGSTTLGVLAGLLIGCVLSFLAALGQPGHYLEIVLPGMLVGGLVGFVTQRYPQSGGGARTAGAAVLVMAMASCPALLSARWQPNGSQDALAPVAVLVGRWTGTTEGQPGTGTVEREYERVLGSRFIQVRNRSTYPPQEKNPKGEAHEDVGFFSFDSARKRIVLRQFHTEGFVNQYVLSPEATSSRLVLTTEAIENIPSGWRARETYVLSGRDQLEEIFELAEPGKDFALYSRNRLTRAR
jgi:nitrobindin-like protein